MKRKGVEIVSEKLDNHPHCPHGPTLLFSREIKGKKRKFYACSACRERKQCNFFLWEDESSKFKNQIWEQEKAKYVQSINHRKMFRTLAEVKKLHANQRRYCHTCMEFEISNIKNKHVEHELLEGITDHQLCRPTEILPPLEDSKKEAQYLFSNTSVETLVGIFKALRYRHIICIGTPRIHEYVQNNCPNMTSILLDIDKRFHSFFGPLQYCWYNIFNHHFFSEEAKALFDDYLQTDNGKNMVLVTDPPFGGRIEPLALTLSTINDQYKIKNNIECDLPMFWIFPYFMEPQILNRLSTFTMIDYKVDYDNHSLFQDGPKGRKQGSPVRIFTNVSPGQIKLPDEGYKYCQICDKWVANENNHCRLCGSCTSKSGITYKHCSDCNRCIKPTWIHCKNCNRCAQVDHKCSKLIFSQECFHCKQLGHKKIECPKICEDGTNKRKKQKSNGCRKKLKHSR